MRHVRRHRTHLRGYRGGWFAFRGAADTFLAGGETWGILERVWFWMGRVEGGDEELEGVALWF